jgi:hypothetical protein
MAPAIDKPHTKNVAITVAFRGAEYASSRLPDQYLSPASTAVIRLAMAFVVARWPRSSSA